MNALAVANRAPPWRDVLVAQLLCVGLAVRREGRILLGLCTIVVVLLAWGSLQATASGALRVTLPFSLRSVSFVTMVALISPFGVWRDEDPSRRAYHWMLPVEPGLHTMTKILAGWVWLLGAMLVYLALAAGSMAIAAAVTASRVTVLMPPAWQWVVALTSATIAYLLGSILVVGSDRPWHWMIATGLGYPLAVELLRGFHFGAAHALLKSLVVGRVGLMVAFVGTGGGPLGESEFTCTRWVVATMIWAAVALACLFWVAYRAPRHRVPN